MTIAALDRIAIPVPSAEALLAPGGEASLLDIGFVYQSETLWCWAADGEMLFPFFQKAELTQCQFASMVCAPLNCCPAGRHAPAACNKGQWPDVVYPLNQLDCSREEGHLDEDNLLSQLQNEQKPVQVVFQWADGARHVALIVGQLADGRFQVHDSLPDHGQGPHSYDEILQAYGQGKWEKTITF